MPRQMGKRVWPEDAHYKITVRATLRQLDEWGRFKGKLEAALFLAQAGDYMVKRIDDMTRKAERREARRKKGGACPPSK
ncbi:MAG TPA: hypothetical protein VLT87_20040 [Thermoanaerobaculia bacterium]|nr:hypothetical protein [Thermoanaerobaculia bacterium]